MNPHWSPSSFFCQPCLLNFTQILRFEDLAGEEGAFKRLLGVEEVLPEAWRNSNAPGGMGAEQLTQMYFQQLTGEEVERLYRIYRDDFLMFGYEFKFGDLNFPPTSDLIGETDY